MTMRAIKGIVTALVIGTCLVTTGCAWKIFKVDKINDAHMKYAEDLPVGISFAWRTSDKVWLVPARNTLIGAAASKLGQQLVVKPDGSYFSIDKAPAEFFIEVNGIPRPLVIPL